MGMYMEIVSVPEEDMCGVGSPARKNCTRRSNASINSLFSAVKFGWKVAMEVLSASRRAIHIAGDRAHSRLTFSKRVKLIE